MWSYSYFSDSFHSADLIKLVEQQPVLWNTYHANHSNKQVRNKAWESIAQKIVRNWSDLPDKEKFGCLSEIKSKWKNIKDTFTKEKKMRLRNKGRTWKKRKYIYTDMLQFLNFSASTENFLEDGDETRDNEAIQENSSKEEPNDSNTETDEPQPVESPTYKDELSSSDCENSNDDPPPPTTRNILFVDSTNIDEDDVRIRQGSSFVSSSSTGTKRGIDEVTRNDDDGGDDPDKMFLLSMLPLFKNLSEHSKIVARIQLTQVLQKLLYPKKC